MQMDKIGLKSRAKINLSLDVLRKRRDGYHEIETIMQEIDLHDRILLKTRKDQKEVRIITDCPYIPKNSDNIAYQAGKLIIEKFNIPWGLDIAIDKHIPIAAGLGGGSSNAATVLMGLNKMWGLGLTREDLMELGLLIGADVPFCILGGAALARGIGEKLEEIKGLQNTWFVLAKPPISVSSGQVYSLLDLSKIKNRPDTPKILQAMETGNLWLLSNNMVNVLETVTEERHTIIRKLKGKMREYQALASMMSGSGPTVFGIFKSYKAAKSAYSHLKIINRQTYLVKSHNRGKDYGKITKS